MTMEMNNIVNTPRLSGGAASGGRSSNENRDASASAALNKDSLRKIMKV